MDSESRVKINSKFLNKFIGKNVKRYLTFLIQQYFSVVESLKVLFTINVQYCILIWCTFNQERPEFLMHWPLVTNIFINLDLITLMTLMK